MQHDTSVYFRQKLTHINGRKKPHSICFSSANTVKARGSGGWVNWSLLTLKNPCIQMPASNKQFPPRSFWEIYNTNKIHEWCLWNPHHQNEIISEWRLFLMRVPVSSKECSCVNLPLPVPTCFRGWDYQKDLWSSQPEGMAPGYRPAPLPSPSRTFLGPGRAVHAAPAPDRTPRRNRSGPAAVPRRCPPPPRYPASIRQPAPAAWGQPLPATAATRLGRPPRRIAAASPVPWAAETAAVSQQPRLCGLSQ